MEDQKNWQEIARNSASIEVKVMLAQKGMTQKELAQKLTDIGINETQKSVAMKLSRGTFNHDWFLLCQHVIGIKPLN